ncbi:MAG: MAPEG family protein [Myxococcota bacterium]
METHASTALLFPMVALVAISFAVLLRLFRQRARSVRAGQVSADYFAAYQGDSREPVASIQLARHFTNLFEAPVLFYAACLAALATQIASPVLTGLAWGYVALRAVHTWIHTGSNALRPRIAAYFGSWCVLLTMWAWLAVAAASR